MTDLRDTRLPGESPCVFDNGAGWWSTCRTHGWSGPPSQRSRVMVCPDIGMATRWEAVERIRSHHDRTLGHSPTNRIGYCAEPDGISATYCETGILLAGLR